MYDLCTLHNGVLEEDSDQDSEEEDKESDEEDSEEDEDSSSDEDALENLRKRYLKVIIIITIMLYWVLSRNFCLGGGGDATCISPQVNTITTTVPSQEYTGGGGALKFWG